VIGTDGLQVAYEALVSAAIVFGGAWTLYKFGLQRALEPYIQLDVTVTDKRVTNGYSNLVLKVKASNIGNTGVGQKLAWLEISVLPYNLTVDDSVGASWPQLNTKQRRITVFRKHAYLEPREEFTETLLIQIPSNIPYILARLIFSGTKPGQTWHTQTVHYAGT
jgi:hypothetical protein